MHRKRNLKLILECGGCASALRQKFVEKTMIEYNYLDQDLS